MRKCNKKKRFDFSFLNLLIPEISFPTTRFGFSKNSGLGLKPFCPVLKAFYQLKKNIRSKIISLYMPLIAFKHNSNCFLSIYFNAVPHPEKNHGNGDHSYTTVTI